MSTTPGTVVERFASSLRHGAGASDHTVRAYVGDVEALGQAQELGLLERDQRLPERLLAQWQQIAIGADREGER